MSGFSPEWLALREPIDFAARSDEVTAALAHYFLNDTDLHIVDIGGGTGSTIRAIAPILPSNTRFSIIDNDPALLKKADELSSTYRAELTLCDLSTDLSPIFSKNADLIATSAFLDLVSENWLTKFVDEIVKHRLPFYAALTYDGRAGCDPSHSLDSETIIAFNQHQRTNKGFGNALGPNAAATALSLFKDRGYHISKSKSDWKAGPNNAEFQKQLLIGWANAASEIHPDMSGQFSKWLEDRLNLINEGSASLFVGHVDFLAVPAS